MTITIPSPENQLIELENDRLKLQIEKELLSSSTHSPSFSEHYSMREKRLHIAAEQGRLKELPPEVWWLILMDAPQTAVYCPCFSEFSGWEWVELLARYPQLSEFCEDFNIFLWPQIFEIVSAQPELLCRFPQNPSIGYPCSSWTRKFSYSLARTGVFPLKNGGRYWLHRRSFGNIAILRHWMLLRGVSYCNRLRICFRSAPVFRNGERCNGASCWPSSHSLRPTAAVGKISR